MGSQKWGDSHFGKRLRALRENRGWSQAETAKMLSDRGIQPMHPSTVAKIEAGDRSVRINEAVGIADVFEVSVDSLLGRNTNNKRDLEYLLEALSDTVFLSRTGLERTAQSLRDRMEDIPPDYERYDALAGLVRSVLGNLEAAGDGLNELVEHFIEDIEASWASALSGKKPKRKLQDKE
ncbi:helix-turn-helix transcriptional regulator [Mycobacterium paraense]|uniref:helix-turn-helix domain-containing protein n=1 Tax=Mycobacterium paraense TaxID=767916 RepID=UPI000A156390|nr:helix-turn-helix transcriptional regulator [Mycobacterium paraense]MCV7441230.1 helix-turn-helix transcriptional regulator [Mycobacterium paraense]ORW48955.1 hypothetical protein AWB89_05305 [Mycobacterium paraense]